jgi:hypothetical protein
MLCFVQKQGDKMDGMKELQEKLLREMETMNDCCRPLLGTAIDLANMQAQEMDRFWKAIGLHGQDISVDDAIEIVLGWKKKATAQRKTQDMNMTREEAKRTIRGRVVVKYGHTASLRHADDVIDALCDEYETKIYDLMRLLAKNQSFAVLEKKTIPEI